MVKVKKRDRLTFRRNGLRRRRKPNMSDSRVAKVVDGVVKRVVESSFFHPWFPLETLFKNTKLEIAIRDVYNRVCMFTMWCICSPETTRWKPWRWGRRRGGKRRVVLHSDKPCCCSVVNCLYFSSIGVFIDTRKAVTVNDTAFFYKANYAFSLIIVF